MTNIRQIYLDLDGVFVDFQSIVDTLFGKGIEYGDIPAKVFWKTVEKIPHLFLNLNQIPGSSGVFKYVTMIEKAYPNIKVSVLTSIPIPTGNLATATADKEHWVKRNLSPTIPVICVTGGIKKAKYATQQSLLIDDLPQNIEAFSTAGGMVIQHKSPAETLLKLISMFPNA